MKMIGRKTGLSVLGNVNKVFVFVLYLACEGIRFFLAVGVFHHETEKEETLTQSVTRVTTQVSGCSGMK